MSYTIRLKEGKYLVTNDNGSLTILRRGEDWPAAEEIKHDKVVLALAQRIEELETTIRAVVGGTLICGSVRNDDGMRNFGIDSVHRVAAWEATLRKVLEQ